MTEVFTALTEVLRDNLCVVPLKVALLPALGEFMFYAATQEEGEDKKISNWDPPGIKCKFISFLENEELLLYALLSFSVQSKQYC